MECPKCKSKIRRISVKIYRATNKVDSLQCTKCNYFEFEPVSSDKTIHELREK